MCIYILMCVYIYMLTHLHIDVYIHINTFTYERIYTHQLMRGYQDVHTCMSPSEFVQVFMLIPTHVCICMNKYIRSHVNVLY